MKKIIVVIIAFLFVVSMCLAGCNKQIVDLTYNYDYAILELPNGEIVEGEVESWKDYDGDQIQVKIDGVTYLVHSVNVCLIDN